ncbi:MAG: NnrS family protein, partial [Phycisphaerales bacterium]|nr:NnrS family protein [Phycisphaerales bacterium]
APGLDVVGLHVLGMGGLGVGVLGVFSIAGKLHTGQELGLSKRIALAFALLLLAVVLRAAPTFGVLPPGPMHGLASLAWAAAFLIWLRAYWPAFSAQPAGAPSD